MRFTSRVFLFRFFAWDAFRLILRKPNDFLGLNRRFFPVFALTRPKKLKPMAFYMPASILLSKDIDSKVWAFPSKLLSRKPHFAFTPKF